MKKIKTASVYTIENYKSANSRDGGSFRLKLCRDGEVVASVVNDGRGGPMEFNWKKDEKTILVNELKGQTWDLDGKKIPVTPEHFVGVMIEAIPQPTEKEQGEAQHKAWCKKSTVFKLKTDMDPKAFRSVKAPFDANVKAYLVKKYGDQIDFIMNERYA